MADCDCGWILSIEGRCGNPNHRKGNMHQRVPVGVSGLIYAQGQVLLGKRKGAHGAGVWAAPGGKPLPGEHPDHAVAREVLEETGIEIGDRLVRVPFWQYDAFPDHSLHFVTIYYAAFFANHPEALLAEPDKCEGWEWFDLAMLPSPLWAGIEVAVTR